MSRTQRVLDFVFVFMFVFCFIVGSVFDAQLILPASYFNEDLQSLHKWYIETYKDPLFSDPPVWFLSMVRLQFVLWKPFYIIAIYAFARGRYWIRIPCIMYAVNMLTSMYTCISYIEGTDFYYHAGAAPHTDEERAALVQNVYAPAMIFGVVLLISMFLRKPDIHLTKQPAPALDADLANSHECQDRLDANSKKDD